MKTTDPIRDRAERAAEKIESALVAPDDTDRHDLLISQVADIISAEFSDFGELVEAAEKFINPHIITKLTSTPLAAVARLEFALRKVKGG